MLFFGVAAVLAPVLIALMVLIYCRWLVKFTGSAEPLRDIPAILREIREMFGWWRRR